MGDSHIYDAVRKQHSPEYFSGFLVLPRKNQDDSVHLQVKKYLLFFPFMK